MTGIDITCYPVRKSRGEKECRICTGVIKNGEKYIYIAPYVAYCRKCSGLDLEKYEKYLKEEKRKKRLNKHG